LAVALGLTPAADPMDDAQAIVARIRAIPAGGNVLVVGHSDTIPELLKALGHPQAVTINDSKFDNLFIVTPGEVTRPRVTQLRYRR
jgi:hypothetical protein